VAGTRIDGRHFDRNVAAGDSVRAFSEYATCSIVTHAAANSAGNMVVVWQGDPDFEGEKTDVCARRCGADGVPVGLVIRVNEFPNDYSSYNLTIPHVRGRGRRRTWFG
jgi:hypothetical protein